MIELSQRTQMGHVHNLFLEALIYSSFAIEQKYSF